MYVFTDSIYKIYYSSYTCVALRICGFKKTIAKYNFIPVISSTKP